MMRQNPRGLLALTATLCAFTCFVGGACGGDDDPASTTSGTGGAGTGGEELGGFMAGPTGSGGGMNGGGGEGGTGEVTNVWGKVLGGAGSVFPKDVAIDGSGNIIVVGAFSGGTVDFGGGDLTNAGGTDIFIAKFSGDGSHLWSVRVGGSTDESVESVDVDSAGNILLGGTFQGSFSFPGAPSGLTSAGAQFSDAFLAKLTADGDHVFSAAYGLGASYGDDGNGVAAAPNDHVVFTGRFQNSADFGGGTVSGAETGDIAVFLASYDPQGNYGFAASYGDALRQEGLAVAAAANGDIGLVGYTWGNVDFGGGSLNTDQTDADRPTVARFDATGTHLFSTLGFGGEARAVDVAFAGEDMVVAGTFKSAIDFGGGELEAQGGNDDIFVTRFDAMGDQVFHRRFGDAARDQVAAVDTDSMGYSVIAGTFDGQLKVNFDTTLESMASVQDAFLLRLGPGGNGYAGVSLQADNSAQAESVAVDPNDDMMVVVGRVSGAVDFGDGAQSGSADLFVAKYAP